MQTMLPLAVANAAAQAVGAVILAGLLFWFQRRYERSHLALWSAAWTAQAVSLAAAAVVAAGPAPTVLTGLTRALGVAAALSFATLVWQGTRGSTGIAREPLRARFAYVTLVALAGASWTLAWTSRAPSVGRYFAMVGLPALVAAVLFWAAAARLWMHRPRGGVGFGVLAAACAVYAIDQLQYGVVGAVWIVSGELHRTPAWVAALGGPLQLFIGLGMLVSLLEEERSTAIDAAERAEHLAYHDSLTSLPNRQLFSDRLAVELTHTRRATHRNCAVVFLDLDRFKIVNDSLGHAAGDRLLRQVSERLLACTRRGDTVARLGGDEFGLILPGTDARGAGTVAANVLEALRQPVELDGRELFATASLGIAVSPDDGIDAETLGRNADSAMYRAKEEGRDTYRFHRGVGGPTDRLDLETALRRATERGELRLFFQPLADTDTGQPRGYEALLRWQHQELGLIGPDRFLALAEATGRIVEMGAWVIHEACRQLREWHTLVGDDSLRVNVNLSARHFAQPHLLQEIASEIQSSGIPADRLEIEITEGTAMSNLERSVALLNRLKGLGVRIALDDFGAGYSAMTYLRRFPLDTLKIDRSFVQGVTREPLDAAIVDTLVHLAHTMGLEVIAEGVETPDQLAFIRDCGAELVQGYLLARPLPASELTSRLLERNTALGSVVR